MATFVVTPTENLRGQLASIPPDFEVIVRHDGPLWPELEIASGRWTLKGWTPDPRNGTYRYNGKEVSFQPATGSGQAAPAQGVAWAAGSFAHPESRYGAALTASPPQSVDVGGFRALVERAPYRFATVFYVDDRDLANAVDKRVETLLLERVALEVDRRAREVVDRDPFREAQQVADAIQADREAIAAFLLAASRSGATACRAPRMVLAEAADAIRRGVHARGEGSDR